MVIWIIIYSQSQSRMFQLYHSIYWLSYQFYWSIYPDTSQSVAKLINPATLSDKEGSHNTNIWQVFGIEYGIFKNIQYIMYHVKNNFLEICYFSLSLISPSWSIYSFARMFSKVVYCQEASDSVCMWERVKMSHGIHTHW